MLRRLLHASSGSRAVAAGINQRSPTVVRCMGAPLSKSARAWHSTYRGVSRTASVAVTASAAVAKWRSNSVAGVRFMSSSNPEGAALSKKGAVMDFGTKQPLPTTARVVIIGGGVVGCSVAYHLSKLGMREIVIVESGQIGCGTTWHAAGLIGQMRSTAQETQLSGVYGTKLYAELEKETGVSTGFRRTGSLTIARTADRMVLLERNAARARAYGIQAEMISGAEAGKKWDGLMRTDDLKGALWLPGDGTATSSDLCASLAAGAKQSGAVSIHERTRVTSIERNATGTSVSAVHTNRGVIRAEIVVNCGGQWARKIGAMAGVAVPLHSAEHFYIVTRPLTPAVSPMLPVMRDPDVYTYYREWSGGLVMGGFEPKCKPCFTDGVPDNFEFALLPEDWDHFSVLMGGALERVPALETAQIQMVNGPESFTPDNAYILGEAPECRKFYVAAGFNSSGIASAGGAGKALAEWIVNDGPTSDLWTVDIRRFGGFHNNPSFLRDRTFETLGLHYQISWPKRELESARPLRRSALYSSLASRNAVFGSKFGWERPNYFAAPDSAAAKYTNYGWTRPVWFDAVKNEHNAARTGVALFDQSSFAKFSIQGRDAASFLNRICGNEMDVPNGKIVYTALLNGRGGMESDVTITRISHSEYAITSSTAQGTRDADWIRKQIRSDEFVTLTDITSAYAVLTVMGPKSRELLSKVTQSDISNSAFPFGTAQMIDIAYATVRAARITYVGELGWELYVPTEMAVTVADALRGAASKHGVDLVDAGYYAIDSLRCEKAYRAWGHELSPDYTPFEAGLSFAVKLDKSVDFIGKAALLQAKSQPLTRRLLVFTLDDTTAYPLGGEPIMRNGKVVGYISSAAFGYTIGRGVAMGYVSSGAPATAINAAWLKASPFSIILNGESKSVKASLAPPYDPKSERVRA